MSMTRQKEKKNIYESESDCYNRLIQIGAEKS